MFIIVRLAIGLIFGVSAFILLKNLKVRYKRKLYVALGGILVGFVILLSFLPFENYFVTFQSPQKAYEYYKFGKANVELVIAGDHSDFIIDRNNEMETYLIIPKTKDGWKIGMGVHTRIIAQKISEGIIMHVYQYKNTSDCFITIFDSKGGELNLSDTCNSEFQVLENSIDSFSKNITYYAHIGNFDSRYSVVVNGTRIEIQGDGSPVL